MIGTAPMAFHWTQHYKGKTEEYTDKKWLAFRKRLTHIKGNGANILSKSDRRGRRSEKPTDFELGHQAI